MALFRRTATPQYYSVTFHLINSKSIMLFDLIPDFYNMCLVGIQLLNTVFQVTHLPLTVHKLKRKNSRYNFFIIGYLYRQQLNNPLLSQAIFVYRQLYVAISRTRDKNIQKIFIASPPFGKLLLTKHRIRLLKMFDLLAQIQFASLS